jgi:multisubunit Na+/H+ antiporter MnhB subunit
MLRPLRFPSLCAISTTIQGFDDVSVASFLYATYIPLGLSLLTTCFIIFPLTERVTNAKQVQIMTGISGATYWLSNFLFDFVIYLVSILIMLGILVGMDTANIFSGSEAIGKELNRVKFCNH